jgi:twitching motility protein PilT
MRLAGSLRAILSQKLIPTVDKTRLVPAVEVLVCTPTVSKYIEEGRFGHIYDLIREGGFWGMQTMNQAIYKLYKDGYISEEEALANAGVLSEMRQILRKG